VSVCLSVIELLQDEWTDQDKNFQGMKTPSLRVHISEISPIRQFVKTLHVTVKKVGKNRKKISKNRNFSAHAKTCECYNSGITSGRSGLWGADSFFPNFKKVKG
jgi:hypothetical protein